MKVREISPQRYAVHHTNWLAVVQRLGPGNYRVWDERGKLVRHSSKIARAALEAVRREEES